MFPVSALGAEADAPTKAKSDYVYVKAPAGELGFKRVPGRVTDITREYVLFVAEGTDQPRLYVRDEAKRVELHQDNKEFKRTVEQYWGEQRRMQRGQRSQWEWISDLVAELLPSAVLLGIVVLFCLYVIVSTALQGYERFVLEGKIKRLNTAKLMEEIEKLRIEVIELRRKVGIAVVEEIPRSEAPLAQKAKPEERAAIAEGRAGAETSRTARVPEIHVAEFIKYQILRLRTPAQLEARRQKLVNKWRSEKTRGGWSRVRYFTRSLIEIVTIVVGWMFVAGWVGAVALFVAEPASEHRDLGGGFIVFLIFLSIALTIALLRLMQDRRIRKESYEEVFSGDVPGSP